jgi:hypothetical protein
VRHFRQKKAEDFTVLRFEMRETSEEGRGEKFRMSLVIGSYCYQLQEMLLKVTLMRNRYLCNTLLRSCVSARLSRLAICNAGSNGRAPYRLCPLIEPVLALSFDAAKWLFSLNLKGVFSMGGGCDAWPPSQFVIYMRESRGACA